MIWLEPVLATTGVLVLDQASKALVVRMGFNASGCNRRFVSIRQALNQGGALASFAPPTLLVVWGVTVVLVALALYGDAFYRGTIGSVGFGAALGGATGNMLDRMRKGAIVDFIAVGRWPVFNLADVAIVSGVGLVVLSMR